MIRITGGEARGRKLKSSKGLKVRPTLGRIRETLFDVLRERVKGTCFLDLFAGTGVVAIEALSRGASRTILVEKKGEMVSLIRENLVLAGYQERALVIQGDVMHSLNRVLPFAPHSIIFADPPYTFGACKDLISIYLPLIGEGGVLVVQHLKKFSIVTSPGFLVKRREIGEHCLTFMEGRAK